MFLLPPNCSTLNHSATVPLPPKFWSNSTFCSNFGSLLRVKNWELKIIWYPLDSAAATATTTAAATTATTTAAADYCPFIEKLKSKNFAALQKKSFDRVLMFLTNCDEDDSSNIYSSNLSLFLTLTHSLSLTHTQYLSLSLSPSLTLTHWLLFHLKNFVSRCFF